MPGFSGSDIEDMSFDFTKWLPEADEAIHYTPGKHVIPEPSSVQITAYFGAYSSLLRDNANRVEAFNRRLRVLGEDDTEARVEIETEYEKWDEENAERTRAARANLLASLCSDQPNSMVLNRLPGRVFDAFQEYVQGELTGKGARSATTG